MQLKTFYLASFVYLLGNELERYSLNLRINAIGKKIWNRNIKRKRKFLWIFESINDEASIEPCFHRLACGFPGRFQTHLFTRRGQTQFMKDLSDLDFEGRKYRTPRHS